MLRWTLECTCLFQIWFPWCVCQGVGLLGHMAGWCFNRAPQAVQSFHSLQWLLVFTSYTSKVRREWKERLALSSITDPTVLTKFSSLSYMSNFQFILWLWLIARLLKWLALVVLPIYYCFKRKMSSSKSSPCQRGWSSPG